MPAAASSSEARTVLVISASSPVEAGDGHVAEEIGSGCVEMDGDSAVAVLRSDPFAISAVVLSGDGASPVTAAVLDSIKQTAPRIPIVFLDEKESADSELAIRRNGVHYYSHLPVNRAEIASVLAGLRQESGRREAGLEGCPGLREDKTTGKGEGRHA
jgi:CheY-like chemotaxis protein